MTTTLTSLPMNPQGSFFGQQVTNRVLVTSLAYLSLLPTINIIYIYIEPAAITYLVVHLLPSLQLEASTSFPSLHFSLLSRLGPGSFEKVYISKERDLSFSL